jgi:class 3 adenylate cyclase
MVCASCGTENPTGTKFCEECGNPLAQVCQSCGTVLRAGTKFCGECGSPQIPGTAPASAPAATAVYPAGPSASPSLSGAYRPAPAPAASPGTELRHVSVLFCDLVGFTPLAEKHDPEEVRDLLSGYFELARAIVNRYGGIVEKFIGDAVMAVWGAPVAKEDDAERAVRAGLELVSAVSAYGAEHGTELKARVGIVTGGVATTETPEEGLVIGDRVNTAARIQSAAPPGCCYVDETTRAATAVAIAYVDAGEHELKGKAEPVRLAQATRVVAAIAGSQRSGVLEAPFIGRDHELRLVKELFHASSERQSARMVLVSGVAGVGKSRLAWEFFKYIDGLAGDVLWHAGRCLSYGEGVSYWALSEMVRSRLQISEEDPQEVVAERLRSGLERWIPDGADRDYIAPRLGQLLGLPSPKVLAREELFSGWRLFFERLAEYLPVVMVVEDLQWADAGMVDFLDHLLEWSGDHAIFLLVLSRPEGTDRKGLGLSRRSVTALPLDPLSDEVVGEMLDGLVAGLPLAARARIVERAEGIPLYAIETVRSLLDKGVLEKGDGTALHLVGELGELEIPPGLTALIASRLDALGPDERQLVKECSVLGGSFPRQAIEAVSDADPGGLDELLSSLVRKEVLVVRADKLSPERGQYAFTQSLIRSVAYDMLNRAERKARHLKTAEHLRSAFPDEGAEVAEVIGAHLYDAYKAAGDDPDSETLRAAACEAYAVAAERAESIGAPEAAEAAYLRAAELSSDEAQRARFTEMGGQMAYLAGWGDRAAANFESVISTHTGAGRVVEAARVTSWLGQALNSVGQGEIGIARMRAALASLEGVDAPPEVIADLQARLAGALIFSGHGDEATIAIEEALILAQHYELDEQLVMALGAKATLLTTEGRPTEAQALYEMQASVARRLGRAQDEALANGNLSDLCMTLDIAGADEHCQAALAAARRVGARRMEQTAAGNLMYVLIMAGRLDEAYRIGTEVDRAGAQSPGWNQVALRLAWIEAIRGNSVAAREHIEPSSVSADSDSVQTRVTYLAAEGFVALAEGDTRRALEATNRAIDENLAGGQEFAHEAVRIAYPDALEAAMTLRDLAAVAKLIEHVATRPRGEVPPFLRAQGLRAEALLAAAEGRDEEVGGRLLGAEGVFRELGYPYWAARAQLDRAEWLAGQGRVEEAERLAGEAAATFEVVGAVPMVARAAAVSKAAAAVS